MDAKNDLPPPLHALAEKAEHRAQAIRLQRERIEAARRRLWQRIDWLREAYPLPAAPALPDAAPESSAAGAGADAGTDSAARRRVAMDHPLLPLVEAEGSLL